MGLNSPRTRPKLGCLRGSGNHEEGRQSGGSGTLRSARRDPRCLAHRCLGRAPRTCHLRLPSTRRPILPRPKRLPPPIRPLYPIRHRLSRALLSPRRHPALRRRRARRKSTRRPAELSPRAPPNQMLRRRTGSTKRELTVLVMSRIRGLLYGPGGNGREPETNHLRVGATLPAVASEAVVVSATVSSASVPRPRPSCGRRCSPLRWRPFCSQSLQPVALDASRVLRPVGELALRACHYRPLHSGRYRRRKGASHMTRRLVSAAVLALVASLLITGSAVGDPPARHDRRHRAPTRS